MFTINIFIMKITKYLLLISTVIFLAASCNKDDTPPPEPELPPLTTEGLNTLGCYINGEPWVAEIPPLTEIIGWSRVDAGYRTSDGRFGLKASKKNKESTINEYIRLYAYFNNLGTYDLAFNPYIHSNYSDDRISDCIHYDLDTTTLHELTLLKFDSVEIFGSKYKIAAGTFEFTAINPECNDTLIFTDGRFDAILN